jgi:hypothetical protein
VGGKVVATARRRVAVQWVVPLAIARRVPESEVVTAAPGATVEFRVEVQPASAGATYRWTVDGAAAAARGPVLRHQVKGPARVRVEVASPRSGQATASWQVTPSAAP